MLAHALLAHALLAHALLAHALLAHNASAKPTAHSHATHAIEIGGHRTTHEGRVDLHRCAEDEDLAALQCRGRRLGAQEAAEGMERKAVGWHAHTALLELGALPVELDATRRQLAKGE